MSKRFTNLNSGVDTHGSDKWEKHRDHVIDLRSIISLSVVFNVFAFGREVVQREVKG
jgi:hypothetical protein